MARTLSPPPSSHAAAAGSVLDLDRDLEQASARRDPDRRRSADNSRVLDEYWGTGRVGRIARAFLDETTFIDETTLERRTDRNRDERAVVLRHRRLPGRATRSTTSWWRRRASG